MEPPSSITVTGIMLCCSKTNAEGGPFSGALGESHECSHPARSADVCTDPCLAMRRSCVLVAGLRCLELGAAHYPAIVP